MVNVGTWIFQVCKMCAFSPEKPKNPSQKAEILDI